MVDLFTLSLRRSLLFMADPTYLAGRGAKVFYRPRPSIDTTEPTPQTSSGPLHTLAENLKAALPTTHSPASRDIVIGSLGILHPSVLGKFELSRPCSALEIDVEPLL
jgi:phenylalanyl-tRNA synthetase beta chain